MSRLFGDVLHRALEVNTDIGLILASSSCLRQIGSLHFGLVFLLAAAWFVNKSE